MTRLFAIAILLSAAPAAAQSIEITPFASAGYATSSAIDMTANGVQELDVSGGFTWGAQAAYLISEHLGLEVMFASQSTHTSIATSSGSARLFDMRVDQVLGHVVYQLGTGRARLRPFVFGGLGPAFLSGDDLDGETKLAWDVGGGVKWFPTASKIGARVHVRYKPTRLNASSDEVCGPFGFCQGSLQQFEFAGGVVLRF